MSKFMEIALKEAEKAFTKGEVPVGAVIVRNDEVISRAHNQVEEKSDSTMHAEIIAIKDAMKKLGTKRLTGCSMYVTLEPCAMCAGAMVLSRIDNLFYGADDPKAGACTSVLNVTSNEKLNHRVCVKSGIMTDECSKILSDFFKNIRNQKMKSEDRK